MSIGNYFFFPTGLGAGSPTVPEKNPMGGFLSLEGSSERRNKETLNGIGVASAH
jgi:hypothetical protein